MVTTSSAGKIIQTFEQALKEIKDLVQDLERSEEALAGAALILLREAIKVVLPVLKYVDEPIRVGDHSLRGVRLDKSTIITRDGRLHSAITGDPCVEQDAMYQNKSTDETVDGVLECLINLGKVFEQALNKMEERHQSLAERHKMLVKAAAIFQK